MLRGYYVCLALDTIKIPQERPRLLSNGSLCKKHNRAVVGGSDNESFSQIGGFDGTIIALDSYSSQRSAVSNAWIKRPA